MSTIKDKIFLYLSEKNITKAEFERNCGLSNGYLNNIKGSLGADKLEGILRAYPDLSRDWLLYGEGSMLKEEKKDGGGYNNISALQVSDGSDEGYREAIEKYGSNLIPEYSTEFRGGGNGALLDNSALLGYWLIPNAPKGSFIITLSGNSMAPTLVSGSRLLLAPYPFDRRYPTSIAFGNIFGIIEWCEMDDTFNGYIKILRRHTDKEMERTHWIARSINEDYDDFDISVERVTHLYKVVSSINMHWHNWG